VFDLIGKLLVPLPGLGSGYLQGNGIKMFLIAYVVRIK
jgi:hypothetical protein